MEPRYVSLCPSVTESLFELGAGGAVVGATRYCVRPEGKMAHVERVGGTKDPSVERVASLRPTLVFANEEENRIEDVEALRAMGVDVHTSFPRTVREVPDVLRELGSATGRRDAAERLAVEMETLEAAVRAEAAQSAPRTFVVMIWRKPWMAAAAGTYLSDVLATVGGRNLLPEDGDRYPNLSPERIGSLSPDVVLLPDEPFRFRPRHADELAELTGLSRDRFRVVDGQLLTWHGTRTLRALELGGSWLAPSATPLG